MLICDFDLTFCFKNRASYLYLWLPPENDKIYDNIFNIPQKPKIFLKIQKFATAMINA